MASKTSRKEWVRGLPWGFEVGRYERKRAHWVSERSVGYGFLIGDSVRNHTNLHLYQTGSKKEFCKGQSASFSERCTGYHRRLMRAARASGGRYAPHPPP